MQTQDHCKRNAPGGAMDLLLPLLALLLAGAVELGTEISRQLPLHWLDVPEVHRALTELEIGAARHGVRLEAQKARNEAHRAQEDARREVQRAREELRRGLRQIGLTVRESMAHTKLCTIPQSKETRRS